MNAKISGVVPPIVTPLNEDRTIDTKSLERSVTRLLDAGVNALFALGSSSEVAYFSDAQRDQMLNVVFSTVGGQVPVLVGVIDTMANRITDHMDAAAKYEPAGYVATAPFYAISGPDEIRRQFEVLAAHASAPVWAYDIPVCVHVKLAPDALVQLGSDGLLAGVKDSSGDDVSFRRLAMQNAKAGHPLQLLTGHEAVVDGAYLAGADGSVPGLGNVDPAGYVRMHQAFLDGDYAAMKTEQDRLAALFEIVFSPVGKVGPAAGVGAFKTALRELGVFTTNQMSEPMAAIDDPQVVERIRAILGEVGLL